jgi:hypothetical protein
VTNATTGVAASKNHWLLPSTAGHSNLFSNSAPVSGGGISNNGGTVTVSNSSTISGNSAPSGFGADVLNQGVLFLDSSSKIGMLDGIPATPI